ncbi:MAG: agmatinase [Candidatus Micrarchaeota archaeon]|nr:agmatinase [Candidatus Micrarchaeota archaeon]
MNIFHIGLPRSFLGVPNSQKGSKYVVLSAPYDSTASYGVGMRFGPGAIIEASRQVETYDIALGKDFAECGIYTADELECDRGSPEKNCAYVKEAVSEALKAGKFPLLLGGEHSVSIGAFDALADEGSADKISVLHIDAHADMRDEYEGTRHGHACVMRRCREKFHAISVGIRSYSEEEAAEIKRLKLPVYGVNFKPEEIIAKLKDEVYITIDVDAIDPSECPAVGTPEPGGMHYPQLIALLEALFAKKTVVGADVVELCPIPGNHVSDFLAARLAYKIICLAESNRK